MREYKHIKDCWNAIAECKTALEIKALVETFPRWSGDWDLEVTEDGELAVTNTYFDDSIEDFDMDTDTFEVDLTGFEDEAEEDLLDSLYHDCTQEELEMLGAFDNMNEADEDLDI